MAFVDHIDTLIIVQNVHHLSANYESIEEPEPLVNEIF